MAGRQISRELRRRFEAVIEAIPEGRVATYGQIASLAGLPGRARAVGQTLSTLDESSELPWFRVVNASGRISSRGRPPMEGFQRHLLIEEGVEFSDSGRIDLRRFGWAPG